MALLQINTLTALAAASRTPIIVSLTDGRGDPVTGFTSTDEVIVSSAKFTADELGEAAIDLIPNSEILPANTYYTITVGTRSFLILKSGATQTLFEALVVTPDPLAALPGSDALLVSNNLSDLDDPSEARDNLGLGNSATRDIGTVAGTVAAGDDPRFITSTDHNSLADRDAFAAHPAEALEFTPFLGLTATNVQEAIEDTYVQATFMLDEADEITFAPYGTIASTDVQGAIEEVEDDLAPLRAHLTDTTDAHDASAISFIPSGEATAVNVQDALIELQSIGDFVAENGSYAGTGIDAARFRVTGDAEARFTINAGGDLQWTDGINPPTATSANLRRATTVNGIKTDSPLSIAGGTVSFTANTGDLRMRNIGTISFRNFGNTGDITALSSDVGDNITLAANSPDEVRLAVGGGTRLFASTAGVSIPASTNTLHVSSDISSTSPNAGIRFGSLQDTNLYRSGANILTTDDAFTSGTSVAAPFLSAGTNVATTGLVRLQNNDYITSRNAANSANIPLLKLDGSDNTLLNCGPGQEIFLQVNGTTYFGVGAGYIKSGVTPATSGALRLTNNEALTWRNSTNTGNVELLKMDATDNVIINGQVGASLRIQVAGSDRLVLGGGGSTYVDGAFFSFGTTLGSKIGNSALEKLSFWAATPIVRPSSTGESLGRTAGGGGTVSSTDTFTGNVGATAYTLHDIVKHLKNIGLIAP